MCYSAQIVADYREYIRHYGAGLSIGEFVDLFWRRNADPSVKIPKAMEAAFGSPQSDEERAVKAAIDEHHAQQALKLQEELFRQRKRLADAERTLQSKVTKAATESRRIASAKVEWSLGKLADLRRGELTGEDSRIFPGWYAPVVVSEQGRRVVRPMRYQLRPAGKPASFDRQFPGTYNARRDNLEGFWRNLFGHHHAVLLLDAFYENVDRHRVEGRELAPGEKAENVILEFRPRPAQRMMVACLWSRWAAPGAQELLSFAAITDEPPPEIAAAGHDRCVIPIRPENVDAWLNPDPKRLSDLYTILDDRERPYYEHRLAA